MQPQQPGRAGAGGRTGFADLGELDNLIALARSSNSGRTAPQVLAEPPAPVAALVAPHAAPAAAKLPTERNALFALYRKLQSDLTALAVETRKMGSSQNSENKAR